MRKIFLTDNADSIADSNSEYPGLQGCMNAVSGNLNDFSKKLEEFNPDIMQYKKPDFKKDRRIIAVRPS